MQILNTKDGSCTLYNDEINETYHSIHGAISESDHVYIQAGLKRALAKKDHINILEVGFGTGLNALLTIDSLKDGQSVSYTALEPFILSSQELQEYYSHFEMQPDSLNFIDSMCSASEKTEQITPNFRFSLLKQKLQDVNFKEILNYVNANGFDLVYYDAFAPSKQSEMWEFECFEKLNPIMNDNAILVTYCAQGQFKRHLKTLGWVVIPEPGPHGKREMTVAHKVVSYLP
ncbi:MAG: tRNA (5-methylaminomethyl-2-thiouridine)(34)-methyltransferase MnmD [Bacteroidia bacterium]